MDVSRIIHSLQLSTSLLFLFAVLQWQPLLAALGSPLSLIFLKSFSALSLSQHALQIMPLFIGNNGRQEAINHGTNGGQKP